MARVGQEASKTLRKELASVLKMPRTPAGPVPTAEVAEDLATIAALAVTSASVGQRAARLRGAEIPSGPDVAVVAGRAKAGATKMLKSTPHAGASLHSKRAQKWRRGLAESEHGRLFQGRIPA